MYLTKRQRQMLEAIQKFIEENGYSPTLEEIGKMMGLSSPATVHKHLQNLEAKGQIRRIHNHSRALELTGSTPYARGPATLQLLGSVAAGFPIEAVAESETIEVPSALLGSKECYALRVRGDSMIEDGIHDGDVIVVERRERAEAGQTVVALVNGEEATVKRFYREGSDRIRLQPANSTMEPMYFPQDTVRVQGVVVGLLRKYNQN